MHVIANCRPSIHKGSNYAPKHCQQLCPEKNFITETPHHLEPLKLELSSILVCVLQKCVANTTYFV